MQPQCPLLTIGAGNTAPLIQLRKPMPKDQRLILQIHKTTKQQLDCETCVFNQFYLCCDALLIS